MKIIKLVATFILWVMSLAAIYLAMAGESTGLQYTFWMFFALLVFKIFMMALAIMFIMTSEWLWTGKWKTP